MGQADCIEAGAEDDSIRVTLTVPAGWAGFGGKNYSSRRELLATRWEGVCSSGAAAVVLRWRQWRARSRSIPTGTTVDEFVTALVEQPDLDVTSPWT